MALFLYLMKSQFGFKMFNFFLGHLSRDIDYKFWTRRIISFLYIKNCNLCQREREGAAGNRLLNLQSSITGGQEYWC